MQRNRIHYHSFLVRLWLEKQQEDVNAALLWKGEVFNIQTGRKYMLHSKDDLFRHLKEQLDRDDVDEH